MPDTIPRLTKREIEVLALFKSGHSNEEIASALGISISTVKSHIGSIWIKAYVEGQ